LKAIERGWWQPLTLVRRVALLPLSWLYRAIAATHRAFTENPRRLDVPVVVIGNLVAGGAGKTPTVLATVALLREAGWTPGIVSRGYGRSGADVISVEPDSSAQAVGDEPLLLHKRSGAPVVVGRDRVGAARKLLALHREVDIVVSDDGLQHRRLPRDAQVIVFDERGAGNGELLPAGPLREPLPAWPPARTLVLYNAAQPSTPLPGFRATRRLAGAVSLADWWAGRPPREDALEALRGHDIIAAAGMAAPQRFFAMLEATGLRVTPCPLPDHYDFADLPWPADAGDVVVTEKDAVKLRPERLSATMRVWVVALDFAPEPAYAEALLALLPPRANR
jgi:tetraacyldisaccharide 4'-kinase